MSNSNRLEHLNTQRFAGLHLSGPNAGKTALVVLTGDVLQAPLKVEKVYEKIGSFGSMFSDERLFDILGKTGSFAQVFIDCPLSVPACVRCQRQSCPSVMFCDDLAVAYLLALSQDLRKKGAKRMRPVNPQSQRLWDVLQLGGNDGIEPSYSANLAPLVARAQILQRRLNALTSRIELKETNIAYALGQFGRIWQIAKDWKKLYRNFEKGFETRQKIVEQMIDIGFLSNTMEEDPEAFAAIFEGVEVFQAFIAALVAAMHAASLTTKPPLDFLPEEGWVYLPHLANTLAQKKPG